MRPRATAKNAGSRSFALFAAAVLDSLSFADIAAKIVDLITATAPTSFPRSAAPGPFDRGTLLRDTATRRPT